MRIVVTHSICSLVILSALVGCDKPTPPPSKADKPAETTQPASRPSAAPATSQPTTQPAEASPTELIDEGWQLSNQGDHAEAEAVFRKATKAEKDAVRAQAYNGLGWALLNQQKPDPAVEAFEQCVEIEPTHPGALNGLGWIAYDAGQHDRAIAYWDKAITPDPARATASLAGLAMAYMHKKEYDKAADYYETWLEAEPENPDAKAGLARARKAAGLQPASAPAVLVITEEDADKTLTARLGQEVRIDLEGNATTGYAWVLVSLSGDAIEPTAHSENPDGTRQAKVTYTPAPNEGEKVGSGGTYSIVFRVVEPGQATVKMAYRRPWETDAKPARTFTAVISVK